MCKALLIVHRQTDDLRFLDRPVRVFQGRGDQEVTEAAALDFSGAPNGGQRIGRDARFDACPCARLHISNATQTQYILTMKSAVIPQVRVEPALRDELESVLRPGETLREFIETTVRNAVAYRRVQTAFHARAQAESDDHHRTGVSVPVEAVLERLQSKLDARRKKLGR